MYNDVFGLTSDPFRISPDPRFCYRYSGFEGARQCLVAGLEQARGPVLVSGDVGSGRTLLVRDLADAPPQPDVQVMVMEGTFCAGSDMWPLLADSLGIHMGEAGASALPPPVIQDALERRLRRGMRTVVMVDEADKLDTACLQRLASLSRLELCRHPLVRFGFVGDEALDGRLETAFECPPVRCRLLPLSPGELPGYVHFRLRQAGWQGRPEFRPSALGAIHRLTGGIPRRVNQLAGRVMLFAAAEGAERVDDEDVETVFDEWNAELAGPVNLA